MSKTATNKQKGRKGQQEIRSILLKKYEQLEPDDIRNTPMGTQGEDLLLSPKARTVFPFSIEIKRRRKFSMAEYLKQAASHSNYIPVVFFREDHGEWLACIRLTTFLDMNH